MLSWSRIDCALVARREILAKKLNKRLLLFDEGLMIRKRPLWIAQTMSLWLWRRFHSDLTSPQFRLLLTVFPSKCRHLQRFLRFVLHGCLMTMFESWGAIQ